MDNYSERGGYIGLRPVFSFGTKTGLIDWSVIGFNDSLLDSLRGIFNFLKLCSWFNIIIGFNYRYAPSFKHVCAPLSRYPYPLFLPFSPPPYPVFLPIILIYTFFFYESFSVAASQLLFVSMFMWIHAVWNLCRNQNWNHKSSSFLWYILLSKKMFDQNLIFRLYFHCFLSTIP